MYLNSVQQMVSGELAGEGLQTGFSRHGLPPQRAPLDTVYPLREHLNNVQRRVSGGCCEGLFPDTVCWTRLRNTMSWLIPFPDFFCNCFCNFYGNSLRHRFFFCNSHAVLGESSGYCTKTKQEWPDSGSTLENIFVIFTKLIPRRKFFFVLQNFWC